MAWREPILCAEVAREFFALNLSWLDQCAHSERVHQNRKAKARAAWHARSAPQKRLVARRRWARRVRLRLENRSARTCVNPRCGSVFVPWYAFTKYCTNACRHRHEQNRYYHEGRRK